MANQTEDKARMKRQRAEAAVQLAMQSRWDEAISANRQYITTFGDEAEAYNRLGKALSETGKIREAREAYQKALELDPGNNIARKNLERLSAGGAKAQPDKAQQVDASLFIEEMGKTGVTIVRGVKSKLLATLSAGDEVALNLIGTRLQVETAAGDVIGDVEPKLALRLAKLINTGNRYAAAVAGVTSENVRIIIKETFQDPANAGRLSFPAGKAGDGIRPYTRESLVRSDLDEDEDSFEEGDEWEEPEAEEAEAVEPREESLFEAARLEDTDDADFEE